ncbi:MAG: S9 family peptidase [Candidatus Limnocylindrales bacterium]
MSTSTEITVRPFGSWSSPISVEMVVAGSRRLREIWFDGEDIYWLEARADEGGRYVIVRRAADGSVADVTPRHFNARTMVHEYGGGSYTVQDGLVVFSNLTDGRLWAQRDHDAAPRALTPEGSWRYADLRVDPARRRVTCVREDHTRADREAVNEIVSVGLDDGSVTVLVTGDDFFSHPRLDPNAARMAWMSWTHPDMPWDSSRLWVATIGPDGSLDDPVLVAGGPGESIAQPEWAPDGSLVFCSDRSGWWNLYRAEAPVGQGGRIVGLAPMPAEFAEPQWVFGQSAYAIGDDGSIVAKARAIGQDRLFLIGEDGGRPRRIDQSYDDIASVHRTRGRVVFIGMGPNTPACVVELDLERGQTSVLHRASELTVDVSFLSRPRLIAFPTTDGATAYAFFYAPTNPAVTAPAGERPPLVVISHGGPTANATTGLDLEIQYFTSRGFAVVDIDYRGSTGYGRAYRDALDGAWGIADVEDCTEAARYLAAEGLVDAERLFIRGGSAGGYTTLRALTTGDTFAAGASHYGVGDLGALARDTHKFESRYLDGLVGQYPEAKALYDERSPINHTDALTCPLIVFQGLDDKVVPPAQAERLVAALAAKGLPYAYLAFTGEGHGFRRAENIQRALEAEVSFYAQLFGFELADPVQPVHIENLRAWRL